MRCRRFAPLLFGLVLLLSSTAGLVDHDHSIPVPAGGVGCTSDHDGEHRPISSSSSELRSGSRWHRHVCGGCQLNSQRSLAVSLEVAENQDATSQGVLFRLAPNPRVFRLLANQTRRGPPQV